MTPMNYHGESSVMFDPQDCVSVELLWELHEAPWVTGLLAPFQRLRLILRSPCWTRVYKRQTF